ncbi:sensor histidine kinase [Nocardia aurea]|uniref:sensor histidine kinase n=1 Tax=Nocardia aurea TaxID=2144174 RepID=UPI0018E579BD|nr:nitrate- and nitrite sensing domain-containing protein [Nocardia aurea]
MLAAAVAGVMSHFIGQARQDREWADVILQSAPHAVDFNEAILQERRLTLLQTAHRPFDEMDLRTERQRVDAAGRTLMAAVGELSQVIPGTFDSFGAGFGDAVRQLTELRTRVDADASNVDEVYRTFSRLTGAGAIAIDIMVRHAPDIGSAVAMANTAALFRAADAMSAAHSLAAAAMTEEGLDSRTLREFVSRIGAYHAEIDTLSHGDDARLRGQITELTTDPQWQQLADFEDALIDRGSRDQAPDRTSSSVSRSGATTQPMVDQVFLQEHSDESVDRLRSLWRSYYEQVQRRAADNAQNTTQSTILVGAVALIVTIAAFLVTLWLANRLTWRLKRLRLETLALADVQLPAIMERIRAGERVDIDSELPTLEFGGDEIGQVANAFDAAQRAAVSAAVTEAKTREAVNAVFLNLAHRSQLMAHRQLEVLDAAEAREEDPALMSLLFQLDHLATRERRNAENLIILGGERPGRQWRNPVALQDIVRSAIAETQDYARVQATRFPEVRINGSVVADVIHLLAELIDNATTYSPPTSRVEASGTVVGKGAVVEIIDQGLGIPEDERVRLNVLLGDSPDFGLIQLSSDSRLGLIVVSMLASRNGIKVRLTESDYGGIKAVVLIPATLLADDPPKASRDEPRSLAFDGKGLAERETARPVRRPVHRSVIDDVRQQIPSTEHSRPIPASDEAVPAIGEAPLLDRWQQPTNSQPPVQSGSGRRPVSEPDDRPALPRRRRQESLAPELAETVSVDAPAPNAAGSRTAEQARDLMSAIANGTRQGRINRPATANEEEEKSS